MKHARTGKANSCLSPQLSFDDLPDAAIKESLLGVPEQQLKTFTPESEIVTLSITAGIQKLIPADIHIGCTGLTCPGGSETAEKPVAPCSFMESGGKC